MGLLRFMDVEHGSEAMTMALWEAICMMPWGLDLEAGSGTVTVVYLYAWELLCSVEIFCLMPRTKLGFDIMLKY